MNHCKYCKEEIVVMILRGGDWCCELHRKILQGEIADPRTGKKGVFIEEPAKLAGDAP